MALAALVWAAGVDAVAQDGIEAVRQRGYLRICADPDNLPYSSSAPATPGFEVELGRLIAAELGLEAQMHWHPTYVRALKPLRDGSCEVFMGLPQDKRFLEGAPWIALSRPYYRMSHALVTRVADPQPGGVAELKGKRVAVELASLAEVYVAYRDVDRGLYRTQEQAFAAIVKGESAAALLWFPVAAWLARSHADLRVVPVTDDSLVFPIGVGMRKRERDIVEAVDAALARVLASGRAQEVLGRYGLAASPQGRYDGADIVLVQNKDPVENGRSLFSTACSRCHGADGVGGGTGGALPKLKNYDGGWEKFYRVVWTGRKNTPMAAFNGILTADEVRNIYEYLTSAKQ